MNATLEKALLNVYNQDRVLMEMHKIEAPKEVIERQKILLLKLVKKMCNAWDASH